jgi:trk system potassium uptake protein TrkA
MSDKKKMTVMIAGGGRTGSQLAHSLVEQGYNVRLIEDRAELLPRLHRELPTEVIYQGNPVDPQVLENAGIRDAQVMVACTTDDATNLVLCYMAREAFNITRTIARINNPNASWLYNDVFHIDEKINQADVMSRLIQEEMSLGDMMTLMKLRRGKFSFVEEKVPPGAKAIGMAIKDLGLPDNCVIAGIFRKGQMTLPRGNTILMEEDEVLAITDPDGAVELARLLEPAEYPARPRKKQ